MHEELDASLLVLEQQAILLVGELSGGIENALPKAFIVRPPISLAYAFILQSSGNLLFPNLAMDDRGGLYRELEAVDWIARRGQLFPRSDVHGTLEDGSAIELMLRDLDLAIPLKIFAPQEDEFPGYSLRGVLGFGIDPSDNEDVPQRITDHLPLFTLEKTGQLDDEFLVQLFAEQFSLQT